MNLFDRVKELCQKEGITLAELERFLGFSKGALHKWNTSSPSVDKLEAVADYFHVSINYLLCRTDDPIDYDDPDLIASIPGYLLEHTNGNVKQALTMQKEIEKEGLKDSAIQRFTNESIAAHTDVPYNDLPPEAIKQINDYINFIKEQHKKKE